MNKVFIVMMLFNRQPYIKAALENLFNYTIEPFDLLLWDNGSMAPTQRLLDEIEKLSFSNGTTITIVRNKENLGVGTSLHHAQKYRKPGQHFMQLDSDIIVPKDRNWLSDMIKILENNSQGVQVIGYPQWNPKHFYNNYSPMEIILDKGQKTVSGSTNVVIYNTADILGCCFLGHSDLFNRFKYPMTNKKVGAGCDIALNDFAKYNNIKMAYIRPASMIDFLDNFSCKESAEYAKWKQKTIFDPNFLQDFYPTEVSEDNSPLQINENVYSPCGDKSLHQLGLEHNTDKAIPHNYLNIYDKHLRHLKDKEVLFCEIGVFNGASVKMWEEYFKSGIIIGIDIEDKSMYNSNRISTVVGDQADRAFLDSIPGKFDVILDDGGHRMEQQMISFARLFQKIKPGGIYIIEDLITSLMPNYGGNSDNNNTVLSALRGLQLTGKIESEFLSESEREYIESNVDSVHIYGHYGDISVSTQAITSIIIKK